MFQYINAIQLIRKVDYDKPHFKLLARYENYRVTK